jgi:ATP-dependent exoDNAse (exonuclease V) alpha subunit
MEQNISLVRKYVQEQFVDKGMCADVCVHVAKEENPHAHIMLTMRPLNEDKSWGAKIRKVNKKPVYTTDWNDRNKAEVWRAEWADAVNAELAAQGFSHTVDHRSYERQGVEQIPTIHLGVAATQMERKGIATDRGDINREIIMTNSQMKQIRARIAKAV